MCKLLILALQGLSKSIRDGTPRCAQDIRSEERVLPSINIVESSVLRGQKSASISGTDRGIQAGENRASPLV